jgi:hypothetical protein
VQPDISEEDVQRTWRGIYGVRLETE